MCSTCRTRFYKLFKRTLTTPRRTNASGYSSVGTCTGNAHRSTLINRAPTPQTRFFADPQELFAALSEAEACDETLLAIYHSHPDGAAFPSKTDISAAQYSAVQLIVTPTDVRAFVLEGQRVSEVKLALTPP